ncbi:helix-turn-helix domain-containing protein [Nocardia huaxiensis]|uniref:Helix-turn-helix domain-containing protein n=1 Tax=Nocardia huaxiensis TaxID=2755382 RepID=A0A7D6ZWR2_9NOCA|nr:helix-turn-helix domain-containing protein [Nocardia huaxiensis]QLY30449.1 helix-turn-helix domain-containing protein [Nocardia huaxiensis]
MLDPVTSLGPDSTVLARFVDRLPDLADEVMAAAIRAVPGGEELPEDHFADVVPALLGGALAILGAITERRAFSTDEVAEFITPVVESHAEDRIPMTALIAALFSSVRYLWAQVTATAEPHELPQIVEFGDRLLEVLGHITITTSEVHSDVEQSIYTIEREARRALCTALLRGAPAEELAARADIALEERYDVLAFQLRTESLDGPAGTIVARRRIRQFQHAVDMIAGTTTLNTFDGSTGTALLPNRSHPEDPGRDSALERLVSALSELFGVDVCVAECHGIDRQRLPQIAQETTDLAELARLLGRPSGVYRLDDLLLEYQLTRPGSARDRLSERITPLLQFPYLIETLDAHIRHGSDRRSAAVAIHVHPNTFSYRLRRIAELTGLDPSDPNESRLLAAALTVHRLYPAPEAPESGDAV